MYPTLDDIRGLLPQRRISADTQPNVDEARRHGEAASAELDGILTERGIATPVSETASPRAHGWLRQAATYGAAMRTEAAAAASNQGEQPNPRLAWLERQWDAQLGLLRDSRVALADAVRDTDTPGAPGRGSTAKLRATPWVTSTMDW